MEGFSIGRCGIKMREPTKNVSNIIFSRKVFYGEGDHEPGKEPGDIVIQMEEKEHAVFQRHGQRSSSSTSLQGAGNLPKTRMLSDSNPPLYQLSFCLNRSFQAVTLR